MSSNISWRPLNEKEKEKRNDLWGENSSQRDGIISMPYNIFMPKSYKAISEKVLNFKVREDDIWIITYPKCGTTWTQEIVWHIMNDVNKELGKLPLFLRSPYLEFEGMYDFTSSSGKLFPKEGKHAEMMRKVFVESVDMAANAPSPRIIKSHLPFQLLPPNVLDTAKVVYVCRNPKDTCVSFYYHINDTLAMNYHFKGSFDQFTDCFKAGKLGYGSYFDHLKSGWKWRNHPNMKFIWYEDMRKNSSKEVSALAAFLNHPMSKEKVDELVEHLKFSNMKERATKDEMAFYINMDKFFRKGEVGDWKNYFQGEKLKEWDEWIAKNLEGSGIRFNFQ